MSSNSCLTRSPRSCLACAILAILSVLFTVAPAQAGPTTICAVETLVLFDPLVPENPESVVVDRQGNLFISLALTGEVRKLAPDLSQSTHAVLPIGPGPTCANGTPAIMGAFTLDHHDNLYATVNSCTPSNRGVWKVTPEGEASLLAQFSPDALINGIEAVGSRLYVTDSRLGVVWTLPLSGGEPSVWSDDPLLLPDTTVFAPGPNGIQFHRGELYVANSSTARVVAISIAGDGRPGAVREHAVLPFGGDDFAIDAQGNLWMTTDPANQLLKVSQDGTTEVVLDADDLLDGPTDAAFGRRGQDRFDLYVTNAAFPVFTTTNRPSLMRLRVDVPGAPD